MIVYLPNDAGADQQLDNSYPLHQNPLLTITERWDAVLLLLVRGPCSPTPEDNVYVGQSKVTALFPQGPDTACILHKNNTQGPVDGSMCPIQGDTRQSS